MTNTQIRQKNITLSHGNGGKVMQDLINDVFVSNFDNPILGQLEDRASLDLANIVSSGDRLAFTTDSYVVDPLFFPGSDIGKLAVNGTVNDLAVGGAKPLYLSCSVIIEEGLPIATLRQVATSMKIAANLAGVQIVTGDTKVVDRGAADKLFINTAGIGVIRRGVNVSAANLQPGDTIIVNGSIGNHGAAILVTREELALSGEIESDCQALNGLIDIILDVCPQVRAMRDATRGGLATVVNEFANASNVGIRLFEESIPVDEAVKGVCEILGLDPMYLANEGKLVAVVPRSHSETVLAAMRSHPAGKNSSIIGEVTDTSSGTVTLKTIFGTERIVDMLIGDRLPRIC